MLDGFEKLPRYNEFGATLNIRPFRNMISPFSDILQVETKSSDDQLYLDTFYGLAFDSWIFQDIAAYGKTQELPEYSGEKLMNYGYLRVPFRRIPRRLVKSRAELELVTQSIYSAVPEMLLLYRGQNREYSLNRSKQALVALYGDENAIEPSLIPSSSRRDLQLDEILPEWCAIIQLFTKLHSLDLQTKLAKQEYQQIKDHQAASFNSYNLGLFALALAQHYGLPSVGLDATTRLDIALFFALHEFRVSAHDPQIQVCRRIKASSEPPVIYLISLPERRYLNYDRFRPLGFPIVRPDQQDAYFIHTGWGLSKNDCARNIFLALYLDPDGDFGETPSIGQLFPQPEEDPFGRFVASFYERSISAQLKRFLSFFGWVVPADDAST